MKLYQNSLVKLKEYCEKEGFKGWDPYDGLNSRLFNAIPFVPHVALFRLVMIQLFKRNPVNLRKLFLIPKQYNAKGIGLFLQGYCNLYRAVKLRPQLSSLYGNLEGIIAKIHELAELLISLRSKGNYHGACWGYNFDWQARLYFLFPKETPTIVATNFCATALMEAYEITNERKYLETALSSAKFVTDDLHRSEQREGFLFSYSPLPGNDTVYNASLLGSRLLSYCYKYTGDEEYKMLAKESIVACCKGQRADGAWVYGLKPFQNWVDSFHTGYNLDALIAYQECTGDMEFKSYIDTGFDYYIHHHFDAHHEPKYYDTKKYPIDIHCPGQLFVSLYRLHKLANYRELADAVLMWTIKNMQDRKGYFYYQLKKGVSSKISYMRWSNAFMFCSLTYYLLGDIQDDKSKIK
ncbi:MAG TPA: delta-aminolevulinic acid dehydratase [Lachnospiraceae bacterium]|nr:delta-aminolevulinic acid dehydratase [Lachnospiraceae bacterium]